jgi:hypothetical protein
MTDQKGMTSKKRGMDKQKRGMDKQKKGDDQGKTTMTGKNRKKKKNVPSARLMPTYEASHGALHLIFIALNILYCVSTTNKLNPWAVLGSKKYFFSGAVILLK